MNNPFIEARELIAKAREALRRGDKTSARQLGERAALLAPALEDAWLILAASDPNQQDALAYAQRARELNHQSGRAHRAVEWASRRLKQTDVHAAQAETVATPPQTHAYQTAVAMPALKSQGRNWLLPALLAGAGCMMLGFIAFFALTSPAVASLVSSINAPTQEVLWAPVDIAKPDSAPMDVKASSVQDETTPAATRQSPNATATQAPDNDPTGTPTDEPTVQPVATETPGSMVMEFVEDTPTVEFIPPTPGITVGDGVRWIDVDLTNQMVYAYEGDTVVNSFVVSTGTWLTPTVTGKHKIYVKVRVQDMSGPGYHLRDVPYVMFFKGDYGLHGTYWHNNFGTPMSRGCVNLTIDDAAWLFNWASVGTVVNVHY
jgi:lipoprotein-anchoring transpeptidase ErfK/SrfK